MLIGSINNWGEIQGQINNANGVLTGIISNAGLLGGQVVGMRGLKGDTGDTGDTGVGIQSVAKTSSSGLVDTYTITFTDGTTTTYTLTNGKDGADGQDGADGADGFSPSASVSKVGSVATITITDKDGTTTAEVHDGGGGGASAFIAEYGVTTYADVKDAYDEDAIILCTVDDSGNTVICQLAYYDDANGIFYFAQPKSDGFYLAFISIDDTWDDSYFTFASTDTATQLRDGLMSALDWQKLDGIESGAEVNVQSDWNEADNTADDYIKNKPTIPTVNNATLTIQKNGTTVNTFTANASSNVTADISVPTDTGDLTNGAGFITGVTSTSTPTASTIAEFDNDAQLNSTDMSAQDVSDFVDSLNTSALSVAQVVADMFVTSSHSISLGTISGNSYSASSASVTKSGYTPIGIVGFRIPSSWIHPSRIQITGYNDGSATVSWEMRNYASGPADISLTVEILWRKTV